MKKFNTQHPFLQRLSQFLILTLLIAIAGCSSIRLTYNHGDTLLYWWLNAYVDLDSEQKILVKQDIDELFQWHRNTQLRDYSQLLMKAQNQLQSNKVTQADLLADYGEVKSRTQSLLLKAVPELADLALSLKPEQINQMEKKFASNNDDFRKKNMRGDAAKQQKYRYEKSMDQFELWFGGFSDEQEDIIHKASDARPLDNSIWLDERMRRQNNILTLARKVQQEKPSKEAAMALIRTVIQEDFDRMNQPDRKAFFDAYTTSTAQLVLTVIKIATPRQKEHAMKRMQGWIDDLNGLAAEAKR
ncbi:MAG TPA: DUF6279 family lipoprotein [Janthinobacterium sp.]|jgi:hypothetical protein|nr:DUF6279 family lipoprotein [Janthinobacterium sp.]